MLVVSVVLTWNGLEDTLVCLESLANIEYPYAGQHEVILVDNASTDGTVEIVQTHHPDIQIITNPRNLGYAAGVNIGIRAALERGADYIWLLNNDVTVAADALVTMLSVPAGDETIGIVGPCVWTPAGIGELGARWDFTKARITPVYFDPEASNAVVNVDYVWGCAMLAKAGVFRTVQVFDERYVAYFEDADLCYRAQQAGYRTAAVTGAQVWHLGGRAAARRHLLWQVWRRAVGRLRFFWSHAAPAARPKVFGYTVLREWPLLAAGMLTGKYRRG
ncbi:MAG: glycosyltransferase family 2 protein [Anaerolineae bacterium]|nr:glycosyltransferase family 2 protein [Anaerolineae bacterium]